jgi:hypothetical protein
MGVFGSRLGWGDSIFGNIMGPRRRFPFCDPCALHGWGARRGEHRDEARDPRAGRESGLPDRGLLTPALFERELEAGNRHSAVDDNHLTRRIGQVTTGE